MEHRYSIAISSPSEIINLVGHLKQQLAEVIGWYHSKNSKAHITICEFDADDKQEISKIKTQLLTLCSSASAFDLHFDRIANYPKNGTVCILPSINAAKDLIKLMERIQKNLKVRSPKKNTSPHISIQ